MNPNLKFDRGEQFFQSFLARDTHFLKRTTGIF